MDLCILGKVFGSKRSLLCTSEGFQWVSKIPSNCLIIDEQDKRSIFPACELFDVTAPCLIEESLLKAFDTLGVNRQDIPKAWVQPNTLFKDHMGESIACSRKALDRLVNCGYMETFIAGQSILRGMQRSSVDTSRVKSALTNSSGTINQSVLRSFTPKKGDLLEPTLYSNTRTSTGRMTVDTGPQILTAPKEIRRCIRSIHPGGAIVQADFVSLEPRAGRLLSDNNAANDIYEEIGRDLFDNQLDRGQVKKCVLSAIFGAGERTLKALLPTNMKAKIVVKKLREYFDFEKVVQQKRVELRENGIMQNYFGRPVIPSSNRDSIIYNNWLQSSSVDISLLGFKILLETLPQARPIFLIHDAIILDVPPECVSQVKSTIEAGVKINKAGYFPMAYSRISS